MFCGFNSLGRYGGASRDRTDDLCSAIAALSQLSYSPFSRAIAVRIGCASRGGSSIYIISQPLRR